MQETRRNRIVISLDPRHEVKTISSSSKKRRWPKVLAVFAFLVVAFVLLLAAGGFVWWQRYKTTPAYSLALLTDAAQRSDIAGVEQMLDTSKIVNAFSNQVAEKAANRYGVGLSSSARQRVVSVIPSLMPKAQENIREELAKSVQAIGAKSERRPFFVVALTLPYVVNIKTEGDTAKVGVPNSKTELGLQRSGSLWKVVTMKDDNLVERIVDKLIEDLPAIGQPLDEPAPSRTKRKGKKVR